MNRPHGGAADPSLLDFSANINPLGPPDGVRDVLDRGADLVSRYPSVDADDLCVAAARHHAVPRECVLAGNGGSDLIYLVARLFAGARAQVAFPAFTEYEDACEAAGISVNRGEPDVTFAGNPTSPEGRVLPREQILSLPGALVVDEAFMDFVGDRESLLAQAPHNPRLIVIRSLTKFYAIPGLRIGYLVAVPDTISRLRRLQPPWSVNALAAAAGIAALRDGEYAERTRRAIPALRERLARGLADAGLEPLPSEVNFILCRVADAATLCGELLPRGIAARNCDSFTGLEDNRYVRFAVRTHAENERLLAALREIVQRCPAAR